MAKPTRRAGMTAAQRTTFLDMLAATANVTQSAKAARSTQQAAYRERLRSAAFRARWQDALAHGVARLELKLLQRALGQVEEVADGVTPAPPGTKEPSDRILVLLLAAHRATVEQAGKAERPARGGGDVQQQLVAKLNRMRDAIAREEDAGCGKG